MIDMLNRQQEDYCAQRNSPLVVCYQSTCHAIVDHIAEL
jgi:hypothetical protein